jgi:ABC-type transport system substrate-binding protein
MRTAGLLACTLVFCFSVACFSADCRAAGTNEKSGAPGEQPHRGGIYRIPLLNEPPTLDPAYVEDLYGGSVVHQIFDGLVQFSPELFVIPSLAENWQVEENGKAYRFFLRPNARFHNGRTVVSQDVVFSLSRLIRVNPAPSILPHLLKINGAQAYRENKTDHVSGFTVVNDRVFLVKLDEPYTPFLAALGICQAKILPREEVESKEGSFASRPVGTGPFRLFSREANRSIQLQHFADYFGGAPYLKEIHYLIYAGGNLELVLSDFLHGKLEEMPVYGQIRQKVQDKKDLKWLHRPSLSLLFYGINSEHPALRNLDLRTALGAGIDRQQIVSEVYKGQFDPASTILPPGMPGYQPQSRNWSYDLDLAKRSAKQAMGEEGKVLTVEIVSNSHSTLAQAELMLVREAWSKLGIDMVPKYLPDWSEFERYVKSDSLQLYRYAWFADIPDPDSFLQPLFASDSRLNFMRYRNEEADAILGKARGMTDPLERARLYQSMEAMVAESRSLIPLFYLSVDRVYQPYVHNIQVSALGEATASYHRVWLSVPSEQ